LHSRTPLVLALAVITIMLLPAVSGAFMGFAPKYSAIQLLSSPVVTSKTDGKVISDMLSHGRAEFIVLLPEPDLKGVSPTSVPSVLKANANAYQSRVAAVVQSMGGKVIRRFWIENAMLVEGGPRLLYALAKMPDVLRIVPNFPVHALKAFPVSQVITASSNAQVSSWGVYKIRAPDVWNTYGDTGQGVRIAVLDTGVDISHPALQGKLVTTDPGNPYYPGGWIEFDSNGNPVCSEPHDSGEHGTHVSGTALGGDGKNIVIGVAPGAKLMSALVLPKGSGSFASVLAGIEWATSPYDCNGNPAGEPANVISMSLGASGYYGDYLLDAVKHALEADIVVVAAIGNDGQGTSSNPGNIWGVIGVGAVDENDQVASFSSGEVVHWNNPPSDWPFYGYYPSQYIKPDVSAPGVQITSSVPGGGYQAWDGTSMATPHVSGTVALILSALGWTNRNVPDLPEKVYEALINTAVDLGPQGQDTEYGYGRIDAFAAVQYALEHYSNNTGGGSGGGVQQPSNGTIIGFVKDAASGSPIAGAAVTVEGVGTVETNSTGGYSITVPPGTYNVTAQASGYEPETKTVSVGSGETVEVDFALNPASQGGEAKVAVIGDSDGNIVRLLENAGFNVVAYTSVPDYMNNPDPNVKTVVVNFWDGNNPDSQPSSSTLLDFLNYLDTHNINLIILDGAYEGKGTMGNIMYTYHQQVEQAGYAAPDERHYGYQSPDSVGVYVYNFDNPVFNGIDHHYYLVDPNNSTYADYVYVTFNNNNVKTLGGLLVYDWWNGWTLKGTTIAEYTTPHGNTWIYLTSATDGYWLQYLTPGQDGVYSWESTQVLINSITTTLK